LLELIQAILTDKKESTCFFFVGCYRNNEVDQDHPIFTMMSKLDSSGVPMTKLNLEGLTPEDLNTLVSDATGMFPRLCKPLSNVVFQKTKGNPFFVLEFLRSLVDSRLLKYSLRQKIWIWDICKITSENITDNVLYLLSKKMSSFSQYSQLALKVLSCFGIKVDGTIVEFLSLTEEYSDFREWLDQIVSEGCIVKVGASDFKFVHDKVQEAAYGLIPDDEKNQFHYNLGIILYSISRERDRGGAIFQIVDQINHGTKSMIDPEMKEALIELNFDAGSRALNLSDNDMALVYLEKSCSFLPQNHWDSNYEFSLNLLLLIGKAAFSCGNLDRAYDALKDIIKEGRCLEDKFEAYHVYVTILTSEGKNEAWTTCCDVLSKMGQPIPDKVDNKTSKTMVEETGELLKSISFDDLLGMRDMDSVFSTKLRFYTLLLFIAFWKKPQLTTLIACRMIQISLEHGVCKDSIFGFVQYAAIVCNLNKSEEVKCIQEACRIGKVAMSLLQRYGSPADIMPKAYLFYYGFVAVHTEPLQICADNMRKSFEVGMSTGDSMLAVNNTILSIKIALFGGENLQACLAEVDYHLEVMHSFQHKLLLPCLLEYRETIVFLIGKSASNLKGNCANNLELISDANQIKREQQKFMNKMLQSFWGGHSTRCHYYAKKALDTSIGENLNKLYITWLTGLNSFRGIKNKNGTGSQFLKVKESFKHAISTVRAAAEISRWNFQNKVFLLEAEMFSFEGKDVDAKASYAAAITSSASSRFIHEQGLSCELAGLHYRKIGQLSAACNFLQRAKQCYAEWGSQMKVDCITTILESLQS